MAVLDPDCNDPTRGCAKIKFSSSSLYNGVKDTELTASVILGNPLVPNGLIGFKLPNANQQMAAQGASRETLLMDK